MVTLFTSNYVLKCTQINFLGSTIWPVGHHDTLYVDVLHEAVTQNDQERGWISLRSLKAIKKWVNLSHFELQFIFNSKGLFAWIS